MIRKKIHRNLIRWNVDDSFDKFLHGYQVFREKYVHADASIMGGLHDQGQKPKLMVVACSDSRVDPALLLQCDPGDLFVVRNVANIVPPYEKDDLHHGTSAALEFGVCVLKVKHLILLGHSQCGGVISLLKGDDMSKNDFISNWVSLIKVEDYQKYHPDDYAKIALLKSHQDCLTFPWIKEKVERKELLIHLWFFDIKSGVIQAFCTDEKVFKPLDQ